MIGLGEDELICDLAEVYSIYDYRSYSPKLISTLAVGLGVNSRIRAKQMGITTPLDTLILAAISDNVSNYIWALGGRNGNAPGTFVKNLLQTEEAQPKKYVSYSEEELLNKLYKGE